MSANKKFFKVLSLKITAFLSFFLISFSFSDTALAKSGEGMKLLESIGKTAGYNPATNEYSLATMVGSIIYMFLGLLGVIFMVFVVYAGYLWMTAGGEEEKVKEAQKYIKNGVIGLLIVLASLGLTTVIVRFIVGSTLAP